MKTLARRLSKSRSSADRYGTFDELRAPARGGSTGGPKHPDLVTVEVPAGAQPGQQLKVKLPSGQSVMVTLPPNVQAGSLLQLSVETQRRIAVRLPPTVQPGQMLTARAPDGTTVMFHAPAAARPGLRIQVALPGQSQKGQRFLNVVVPPEYCHGQQLSARRQAQSAPRPSPSWRRSSLPSPRRSSVLPWPRGRGLPWPRAALRTGRAAQPPRAQMPRLRCGRVARPKQRDPILRRPPPRCYRRRGNDLWSGCRRAPRLAPCCASNCPNRPPSRWRLQPCVVVAAALRGGGCSSPFQPLPAPSSPVQPRPAPSRPVQARPAPFQQPLSTHTPGGRSLPCARGPPAGRAALDHPALGRARPRAGARSLQPVARCL